MGLAFYSSNDARAKLNRTIVMFKNEPWYCENLSNNLYLLYDLSTKKPVHEVEYTHPDFNYMCIDLGYLQGGSETYYVTRSPIRNTRQALDWVAVSHSLPDQQLFFSSSMKNCILGNHSSFDTAMEDVLSYKRRGAAFHRHFAVKRDRNLHDTIVLERMGDTIGHLPADSKCFQLFNIGYSKFLKVELNNLGVKTSC